MSDASAELKPPSTVAVALLKSPANQLSRGAKGSLVLVAKSVVVFATGVSENVKFCAALAPCAISAVVVVGVNSMIFWPRLEVFNCIISVAIHL